ncbi:MAG: GNAT family N-acetyltransferase [Candidatus Dormibacteraeota bacterium]|nr:GNAT family N-acetyltransferase [Candidatus Dormibacteraeota bacterium]
MAPGPELRTQRLLLRRWRDEDLEPFAALNSDPEVMRFFPKMLSREESDSMVMNFEYGFAQNGFGLWVVEVTSDHSFAGFVGLNVVRAPIPCAPAVEAGWRLARSHWGLGYATEAAGAALRFGFDVAGLEEIVAFAVEANTRSLAVMQRIGMRRDLSGDFDHPRVPEGPLRRHVLYRGSREAYPVSDSNR